METMATINIPVRVWGEYTLTPTIEQQIAAFATRLLHKRPVSHTPRPIASFRGMLDRSTDIEALRRRAMKDKFGI